MDWAAIDAECLAAIRAGSVGETRPISRRHRHQVLGVDVVGSRAVVLLAIRGKRAGRAVTARSYRRGADGWRQASSSSTGDDDAAMPPRTAAGIGRAFDHPVIAHGGSAFWRVTGAVTSYRCRNVTRPVPEHGWIVVVVSPLPARPVQLLDAGGRVLAVVPVRDRRRWRHRFMMGALRLRLVVRRRPRATDDDPDDGWFNYSPGRRAAWRGGAARPRWP
ncbi:MAG: hypothetical protein U0Q22_13115 [Acidimicrobiales bacterium]